MDNLGHAELSIGNPILVTGAAGYLGSRIRALMTAQEIPHYSTARNEGEQIIACNLEDPAAVSDLIARLDIHTVIHTAAAVPKTSQEYEDQKTAQHSLQLLENLIRTDIKHLVFTSSMTVYAKTLEMPVRENDVIDVSAEYGATKRKAEQMLMSASGMTATILRFPGLFGPPRQSGILYNVARALVNKTIPTLPEDPPLWAALHVDDAADLCLRATLQKHIGSCILNAGYPGEFSLTLAINAIADLCDEAPIYFKQSPMFEMDLSQLKEHLGLPAFTFAERLRELVRQVKNADRIRLKNA